MKTLKSAFLLLPIIVGEACFEAKGQVTIGSGIEPLSGVLLDIKTHAANADNETTGGTAGGGLGLPRVKLTGATSLAPFLPSATAAEKTARAGLTVYNVSTTSPFKPGVYVWDGAKWNVAGGGEIKYFFMPSVNIPITSTGSGKTFDLYDAYAKQFTKSQNTTWRSSNAALNYIPSPESDRLYQPGELDYVITYYDTGVITLGATPISAAGVLTYTVNTLATTEKTYFNIVFVVK